MNPFTSPGATPWLKQNPRRKSSSQAASENWCPTETPPQPLSGARGMVMAGAQLLTCVPIEDEQQALLVHLRRGEFDVAGWGHTVSIPFAYRAP